MIKFQSFQLDRKKIQSAFDKVQSFSIFTFSENESIEEALTKFTTLTNIKVSKKIQSLIKDSENSVFFFTAKDDKVVFVKKVGKRGKLFADTFRREASLLFRYIKSMKLENTLILPVELSDEEIIKNFNNHEYYVQTYLEGFKLLVIINAMNIYLKRII